MKNRTRTITRYKNNPAPIVQREIQISNGISNPKNPSPCAAEAMQSISHINVAAPKIIAKISRCNCFFFLKMSHKPIEMSVAPNATKKYILF